MVQAQSNREWRTRLGTIAAWSLIGVILLLTIQQFMCFTWSTTPHRMWGSQGTGEGQFNSPQDMVSNASGHVYVADTENHRVQVFTQSMQFLFQWGTQGAGNGQFNRPWGIAINGSGHVYVVDSNNYRVQVFTQTGQYLCQWAINHCDFTNIPTRIAINGSGEVYITEKFSPLVRVFTQTGQQLFVWRLPDWEGSSCEQAILYEVPIKINASGQVFVVSQDGVVEVFTPTGQLQNSWKYDLLQNNLIYQYGLEFGSIKGMNLDQSGRVYIADTPNSRVLIYTAAGELVSKWESSDPCELSEPIAVIINATGWVLVLDLALNRVQTLLPIGPAIINNYFIGLVCLLVGIAIIIMTILIIQWKTAAALQQQREGVPLNNWELRERRRLVLIRNWGVGGGVGFAIVMKILWEVFIPARYMGAWMWILGGLACALLTWGIMCARNVGPLNRRYKPIRQAEAEKRRQGRSLQRERIKIEKQWLAEQVIHIQETPMVPLNSSLPLSIPERSVGISTPIQVRRQFEYLGGKVRIKINIKNVSSQGLLRLSITLEIPNSFKLLRIEPSDHLREGSTIKVGDLSANEEKTVAGLFEPLICGKERIGGVISGLDATGTPFAAPMNPLEVEVRCPLFIRPEEANLPTVQRILEDLRVHSERNFYLPDRLTPAEAFELAKSVIAERDVRLVGTFTGEAGQPYDQSAVFYGVTKIKQKRFVITAAVSETDRAIRISSACDEEDACTGFLAEAGASVRRELVVRGAVDSEAGVIELVCERCGATLPRAPMVDRDVTCPECRSSWRVSDFFR